MTPIPNYPYRSSNGLGYRADLGHCVPITAEPFRRWDGMPGGPPYDWALDRNTAWSLDQSSRERHPAAANRLRRRGRRDNHGDEQ